MLPDERVEELGEPRDEPELRQATLNLFPLFSGHQKTQNGHRLKKTNIVNYSIFTSPAPPRNQWLH